LTTGLFLPLTGGTLTGALTGTSGTFSNFVKVAAHQIQAGPGVANGINGFTSGGLRWQVALGDGATEGGSNAGSNFAIASYTDAGAFLSTPLAINRASGLTTFANNVQMTGLNPVLNLNRSSAAGQNTINGLTNTSLRWAMTLGNAVAEGGGNVGSDFVLGRFSDTAVNLDYPFLITRSSGVATFSKAIVNGPSDRSLKENIATIEGALDKINALQGVTFNMIDDETKRTQIGLIAQDVEPVVPEIVQEFATTDAEGKAAEPKMALDYPKLTALLIEAVKTLTARVAQLEAA
jgi:Chaperone of endosialidase